MTVMPWWNSAKSAERASRWIALVDVIGLGLLTIFDALAWGFLERHHIWEMASWITLGCLTGLGLIAWFYGNRAQDLRDKEDTEEGERHRAKLAALRNELHAESAEAAMTAQIAFDLEDRQTPRKLTQEHKAILKESLSAYAGQKFVLVFAAGQLLDGEFAGDLGIVLLSCGWSAPNGNRGEIPVKPIPAAMRFDPGIRIDLSLGQAIRPTESTIRAALDLFYALEKCGIPMIRQGVNPYPEIMGVSAWGPEIIELWIGPKG